MSTATNRKTTVIWDFADDNKRKEPSRAKPSKVWEVVDREAHAVVVNYETSKIPGSGLVGDYFVVICNPCCAKKLEDYAKIGFEFSRTYPGLLLEYSMTEADIAYFKKISKQDYTLVHSYPGRVFETKLESFKEVFQLSKEVILEWRKKQVLDNPQVLKKIGRPKKTANGSN